MYAWIWRHLPFRRWYLKLGLALALIAGVCALLWYVVFPLAEPLLPFDDVQVTDGTGGTGGDQVGDPDAPGGDPEDHELYYSTEEATASPTATGLPR
ncbi:hypothetical protein [Rhizomonospora bruguierae]|uniref:hypothetical protein n=1 Tax=Rhizomonospora bruguierae TaxID=1581705 RepID=UPI001BCF8F5E|nr:hypothetical protein [Micromonospora sp. NBRC 107566]